jgi:hypothetical protein
MSRQSKTFQSAIREDHSPSGLSLDLDELARWAGVLADSFDAVAAGELEVDAEDVTRLAAMALRRVVFNVRRVLAAELKRENRRPNERTSWLVALESVESVGA